MNMKWIIFLTLSVLLIGLNEAESFPFSTMDKRSWGQLPILRCRLAGRWYKMSRELYTFCSKCRKVAFWWIEIYWMYIMHSDTYIYILYLYVFLYHLINKQHHGYKMSRELYTFCSKSPKCYCTYLRQHSNW
jgi:hypothetical protein